ncbi:MAG: class I SAM-dependent methyltransferase [Thermodesulfobacteriota bacterium]|nr:class I SAM-dependent methyltransferase [Thermodesulfobacteriota bacterium]
MDRIIEPELMEVEEQGQAYAQADFSGPNKHFIALFAAKFPDFTGSGRVLDLGCGPADILIRFARRYPDCACIGIDGAEAMLAPGRRVIEQEKLSRRITLHCQCLPFAGSDGCFQAILSNSLLHHLHRPHVLWQTIHDCTAPGGAILIMDLFRPDSKESARYIVDTYAGNESKILQADFYNSLLAAFRVGEVRNQLQQIGLKLCCEEVSDRHLAIWGTRSW